MSSGWRQEGEPRHVTAPDGSRGVMLQYLRAANGVGAHEVRFSDGVTLRMLPDVATTPRKRTGAVSVALGEDHSLLAAVIGELVLAGATNLWIDQGHGEVYTWKPLIQRERTGRWVVEMFKDGEVEMRYVADVEEGAVADG